MKLCSSCDYRFEGMDWHCPRCEQTPPEEQGFLQFAHGLANENTGFKPEYFADLAKLEAFHFWFRNRNRLLIWALGAYFPAARRFLEIGCGTGFVLSGLKQAFPDLNVAGSDMFIEGLAFARSRLPGVSLYQMDALQIPFEGEFDVVGAFDVLEHIEDDHAVLGEMHRAVKPGGGLMLTVPQHPSLWSGADTSACHRRRYTRKELVGKVESAGFKVRRATSFVSLLLPLLCLSRRRATRAKDIAANAEFQMNRTLNNLLEAVLHFETRLIKCGVSFPAGGSLLLLGERR